MEMRVGWGLVLGLALRPTGRVLEERNELMDYLDRCYVSTQVSDSQPLVHSTARHHPLVNRFKRDLDLLEHMVLKLD